MGFRFRFVQKSVTLNEFKWSYKAYAISGNQIVICYGGNKRRNVWLVLVLRTDLLVEQGLYVLSRTRIIFLDWILSREQQYTRFLKCLVRAENYRRSRCLNANISRLESTFLTKNVCVVVENVALFDPNTNLSTTCSRHVSQ